MIMAAKGELNYWVANLSSQLGKSELYTKLKNATGFKKASLNFTYQPLASPKFRLRLNRGRQQLASSSSPGQKAEQKGTYKSLSDEVALSYWEPASRNTTRLYQSN